MLMLQKFISLLFLFFFIIINNTAYANKFKIKDLEIDLFDKNKQIKSSRAITEGYARVKIKAFADRKNIGIWVKNNNNSMKIAAIGIRVKKWIAYHGFSINVNNDLYLYKKIAPCGIRD